MDETTRRNQVFDAALHVGLANVLSPPGQRIEEYFSVVRHLEAGLDVGLPENGPLDISGRVLLLDGVGEPFQERFVQQNGRDVLAILGTTTLGVCRRENAEARFRVDGDAKLLDGERLAFQNRLKAHNLGACLVDFIEEHHGTTEHAHDDRTRFKDRLTVAQTEAANQVVFVRLGSDGHPDVLASGSGTRLLHHVGLAVAGRTRDEAGMEDPRLHGLENHVVITERHERRVNLGHPREQRRVPLQRLQLALHQRVSGVLHRCGRGSESRGDDGRGRGIENLFSRVRTVVPHHVVGAKPRGIPAHAAVQHFTGIRHPVDTTLHAELFVAPNPQRVDAGFLGERNQLVERDGVPVPRPNLRVNCIVVSPLACIRHVRVASLLSAANSN